MPNPTPRQIVAGTDALEAWMLLAGSMDAKPPEEIVSRIHTAMTDAGWEDISTLPEGEHVLLWFPNGERGVGGIEAATIYDRSDLSAGWTHGGANSGSDWEFSEAPTHWQYPPAPPKD